VPARVANRLLGRDPAVLVRALAGVSFVSRAGESIGIIGLNGSGKSTLLRIIAGLEKPMRGEAFASSPPVLLGVNAALLPELSGTRNVRIGCLAMGMTPAAIDEAYAGIVELADIGKAIHLPIKTYSSGMGARLRFAIAVATNPHILLIDEALATGDAAFRDRSEARMKQLLDGAGTVFLVTHAGKTVEELCTRAIWLHRGRLVLDGPAYEVAQRYRKWSWSLAQGKPEEASKLLESAFRDGFDTDVHIVGPPAANETPRHAR
jgi:teichoic acid transport system ATP-binding protein